MADFLQPPPFCVQIELTEGCNLRCPFCGLNGIRGKEHNFKFMTVETAELIAESMAKAGWNSRIEFAMHGEPTMNPDLVSIINAFRKYLPSAYLLMESNGGGLLRDPIAIIRSMFGAGLNTLALDEYQNISLVPKIMAKVKDYYVNSDFMDVTDVFGAGIFVYPECGPEGNPHKRSKKRKLVHIKPIDTSTSGTHATLNNHAGSGAPKDYSQAGKRCAKPFRELSFRWDGRVAVCCNDWRGALPVGDIRESDVGIIWHSPIMYAARRKLYRGERDFGPCDGCNAKSYRTGCLPDFLGKESMDKPDKFDLFVIEEALKKGPLTEPVLRPWEKNDE